MPRTSNPGHLTKHFTSQIYGAFAADLAGHNDKGLSDKECEGNKQWLRDTAAAATGIPDGDQPGKKIHERCQAVGAEYEQWNLRNGSKEARDHYQWRIRHKVDQLSDSCRRRTKVMEEKTDRKVYADLYQATEKLVRSLPGVLSAVPQILAKYPKPTAASLSL